MANQQQESSGDQELSETTFRVVVSSQSDCYPSDSDLNESDMSDSNTSDCDRCDPGRGGSGSGGSESSDSESDKSDSGEADSGPGLDPGGPGGSSPSSSSFSSSESDFSDDHNYLQDFIDKYSLNERVLDANGKRRTKMDCLLITLCLSLRHNWNDVQIEDHLKSMNCLLGKDAIPCTSYLFNKIFSFKSGKTFHFYCKTCGVYLGEMSALEKKSR